MTDPRSLVAPIYDALTRPGMKDVEALLTSAMTPDWQSYGSVGPPRSRDEFIGMVKGFAKGVPDLEFRIVEVIASGERVVVRSEATGTPAGEFMGVPHGGRSFRIMAIDLHTMRDGKSAVVHHVEDWMTAVRQLRG